MEPDLVVITDEVGAENTACLWLWGGRTCAVLDNNVVLLPRAFKVEAVILPEKPGIIDRQAV